MSPNKKGVGMPLTLRTLKVQNTQEALMAGADVHAVENGEMDVRDFEWLWGMHPDAFDWIVVEVNV
jgi:hypothetical protein